ncbi:MAG TPA: uracil-DNA glycosylase [Gammaproteobacteria bacterium]|nr:uracil-DNA glycosylase [Gammaproteobacteria bacterium]
MQMDRERYLHELGIVNWVRRSLAQSPKTEPVSVPAPIIPPAVSLLSPEESAARKTAIAGMDWDALAEAVRGCTACGLRAGCTQTVFGVGARDARWLVVGEAPGADEDKQGEPFVGRAGQLLNSMLAAIGLKREQVYIANILKCRPPKNRDPKPEEASLCRPFLERQIALLKPQLILAVGRIAAQNLLNTETPIGKLRGQLHRLADIPVVVTYHPAYLLRSPSEKRKAWDDLKFALRMFRERRSAENGVQPGQDDTREKTPQSGVQPWQDDTRKKTP